MEKSERFNHEWTRIHTNENPGFAAFQIRVNSCPWYVAFDSGNLLEDKPKASPRGCSERRPPLRATANI
ncbi:MAG: hypothetical protein KA257_13195, partial [Opitutaceae bacterium]|nr:hypothetical protein [Opitutaceae bacterium]